MIARLRVEYDDGLTEYPLAEKVRGGWLALEVPAIPDFVEQRRIASILDEADAIRIANDIPYGLSSYVWSENLGRAHRVAAAIDMRPNAEYHSMAR